MAQRIKKVGIVGKYGTRYGASLGKMAKKTEISQHAKYTCSFCGKTRMKRRAVGTWRCGSCMKTVAGGAWTYSTTSAVTVKSAIRRRKELKDQEKLHSLKHCEPIINGLIYITKQNKNKEGLPHPPTLSRGREGTNRT
ncbi:PREDICTED: putative 60S ribosomal protein L37a [Myotis brandtii]|uniref:putative 60S ribosomal protein L37a n=1 Tax=Myotis brandtii TaxID=109478 RepID=UPI000703DFA1|nr:PREDICTED: putative 60S ribosomal protein L37a [Myotis brandtii]